MGYWIEILCDVRKDGMNNRYEPTCYSHRNANPGTTTGSTKTEHDDGVRQLAADAKRAGWRKTRAGWCCPACRKEPAPSQAPG